MKRFALGTMKQRLERARARKNMVAVERSRDLYVDFASWKEGVVPVVVQNIKTGEVLSVVKMSKEAFEKTLHSSRLFVCNGKGEVCEFILRTRKRERAVYVFMQMKVDCGQTALLAQVYFGDEDVRACHVGRKSDRSPRKTCFYRVVNWLKGELEIEK